MNLKTAAAVVVNRVNVPFPDSAVLIAEKFVVVIYIVMGAG